MNKNTQLLPCPFCANKDISIYKWDKASFYSITCGDENCPLSSCLENRFDSEQDAFDFWQKRYGRVYNPDNYPALDNKN